MIKLFSTSTKYSNFIIFFFNDGMCFYITDLYKKKLLVNDEVKTIFFLNKIILFSNTCF